MAYAIKDGLGVATVLILVFLPARYVIWLWIKAPQSAASETMDFAQTALT